MKKGIIQIFFKAPIVGKVKTRLIPSIGLEGSVIVHQRLCNQVIQCVSQFKNQQSDRDISVQFWVDLDIKHPFVQEKAEHHQSMVFQQDGADLGRRMHNAMDYGLQHADQVVLVGGDCYSLCEDYLAQAFDSLSEHDLVLGPASDGGYILIGTTGLERAFLDDITWGENSVLQETLARAGKFQKSVRLLEERWDIDTIADIQCHAPELLEGLNY